MKTSFASGSRHAPAFTLMELLVVVTIIAILASLVATQVTKAIDHANHTKTLTLAMNLKDGINAYLLDYNRFPLDESPGNGDQDAPEVRTDGSNSLVEALTGVPPMTGNRDLSPKRIQYAEFPQAKSDRHGLVGSVRPFKLTDMWGQPFRILLDTNGDNQVKNPDLANSDARIAQNQAEHLAMKIAVYSSGKDKIPQTADDITTWRTR